MAKKAYSALTNQAKEDEITRSQLRKQYLSDEDIELLKQIRR